MRAEFDGASCASRQVQRLKTREQFQAVLAGATVARTEHFVMHCLAQDSAVTAPRGQESRLGAMVPKRWAKRAATRNLIKRQIFTAASLYQADLPATDYVVRLRGTFNRQQFISAASDRLKSAVRSEIELLYSRARAALARTGA